METNSVNYLCVTIVLLIISYNYLDKVRKSSTPTFSLQSILNDYRKRTQKNIHILRNILPPDERKKVSVYIAKIENVIKNPDYFSRPCLSVANAEDKTLAQDRDEIKKLVLPLERMLIHKKYVHGILKEMSTDYEALLNLSRNSFCKKI